MAPHFRFPLSAQVLRADDKRCSTGSCSSNKQRGFTLETDSSRAWRQSRVRQSSAERVAPAPTARTGKPRKAVCAHRPTSRNTQTLGVWRRIRRQVGWPRPTHVRLTAGAHDVLWRHRRRWCMHDAAATKAAAATAGLWSKWQRRRPVRGASECASARGYHSRRCGQACHK